MPDTFLKKLDKIINAKFIKAAPLRVDFFVHDLETKSESNIEAARTLSKEQHEVLHRFTNGDQLNFYNGGIVLLTKDPTFPIKFYCAWGTALFKGSAAIQTKQIWCDELSKVIDKRYDYFVDEDAALFYVLKRVRK